MFATNKRHTNIRLLSFVAGIKEDDGVFDRSDRAPVSAARGGRGGDVTAHPVHADSAEYDAGGERAAGHVSVQRPPHHERRRDERHTRQEDDQLFHQPAR